MPQRLFPSLAFLALILSVAPATACAEERPFTFRSADGVRSLNAVCFPVAHPIGILVMVNGRSESWLKYTPLFRELNRAGYTVYSYDHRGQGLSPRLATGNPQVGHIDDFTAYSRDLGLFLEEVRNREGNRGVSLVGNSMGAAVIVDFLREHPDHGIKKIVLCSPMFRIKTDPWPEPVARLVLGALHLLRKGAAYAPGEGDALPSESFERNRVTSSREKWAAILLLRNNHPEALTGGASVDWVIRALDRTPVIRKAAGRLGPETLILEAGRDSFVIPFHPPVSTAHPGPKIIVFPEGRHELLMEREAIRREALRDILAFLESHDGRQAIPLDQRGGKRLSSKNTPSIP
jgi:lysophospholipase